jgi:putative nucleotidyltransferase with HDIG domain
MTQSSDARRKVRRIKNLPAMPAVVARLFKMLENPEAAQADVARLIGQDQALSAKTLRLANSPFFGYARKVSSISQALLVLGFDVVKGLVLTSGVSDLIRKSMKGLWEHSLAVAAASGVVARRLKYKDAEEMLLAGLLHDLGKVVLATEMPRETRAVIDRAAADGITFYEAERRMGDFDHGDVGAWLAEHWNLPPGLADPIEHHHQPERAENAPEAAAVVHLADLLVRALGIGFAGDSFVPPLSPAAWDLLKLSPKDWPGLLDELEPALASLGEFA